MCDHRRFQGLSPALYCGAPDLVDKGLDLSAQIFSCEHRDLLHVLFAVRRLLPFAQRRQIVDDLLSLICGEVMRVDVQLLAQLLRHLLRKSHLGRHHDDRLVGILQEVLSDQPFKIARVHLLPERRKGLSELQVDKGRHVIIEPCIQRIEAVYKPLGIIAVIGLPVLELEPVDAGQECSLVQTLVCDLPERFLDGRDEFLFFVRICIFCRDCVAGLFDAELQQGVDILSDPLVPERFFNRGAFRVAEHIIDDLKGKTQLRVLSVGCQRDVPGQIAAALQFLLRLHGVVLQSFGRFLKGRLGGDLRIDLQPVESREISLVKIGKPLLHVHIAVHVNVAVGRMIISSVEIQICLIGQVRNVDRIAAGFHRIGGVGVQRAVNAAGQHIVRR